jgi:hypothetical protein
MRDRSQSHAGPAGAALLALLVAGCAAAPLPYQARPGGELAYGYADGKIDALHYSIVYTDNNRARADDFLEFRAAEIARDAGFAYFAFDKRGTGTATKTEHQFEVQQSSQILGRQGFFSNAPKVSTSAVTQYFYAGGEISLLTQDQAKAEPKAIAVSDVLARAKP